jgi:hypothetical protein
MPSRLLLRVNEVAVDRHFEHAASGGDDLNGLDILLEFAQQIGRQTDGLVRVASNRAVLDTDLHRDVLLVVISVKGYPLAAGGYAWHVMPSRIDVREPAPPTAPTGGGGGGGRWSRVVTAGDSIEAELIRGVLEQADVPVVLDRRDTSPFAWMYPGGNINAPVAVLVPSMLLEPARLALMEASFLASDEPAPIRPGDVSEAPRIGALRMVVAGLVFLVVGWVILVEMFGFAPCALRLFCI